jgi:hypothetical protein
VLSGAVWIQSKDAASQQRLRWCLTRGSKSKLSLAHKNIVTSLLYISLTNSPTCLAFIVGIDTAGAAFAGLYAMFGYRTDVVSHVIIGSNLAQKTKSTTRKVQLMVDYILEFSLRSCLRVCTGHASGLVLVMPQGLY